MKIPHFRTLDFHCSFTVGRAARSSPVRTVRHVTGGPVAAVTLTGRSPSTAGRGGRAERLWSVEPGADMWRRVETGADVWRRVELGADVWRRVECSLNVVIESGKRVFF